MRPDIKKQARITSAVLLILYLILLIWLLFFSERFGRAVDAGQPFRYNLIPFAEIRRFWVYRDTLGRRAMVVNLLGNILAFMPLGVLLPSAFLWMRRASRVVAAGFLLSFLAESVQLMTRVGSFDVDDILLNSAGTLIGYLLFALERRIWRRNNGKKI